MADITKTANLKSYIGNGNDLNYIINTINKIRKDNGLKELISNYNLNNSARKKAEDMVDRNYWSHADPDGNMSWNLIKNAGYNYSNAGENLAKDYDNVGAIEAWLASPSHLENILSPYFNDIGYSNYKNIKVNHFGKKNSILDRIKKLLA